MGLECSKICRNCDLTALGVEHFPCYFFNNAASMQYAILNLFGAHITPKAREILAQFGTIADKEMTQQELSEAIHQYDIIFMGLYPEIPAEIMRKAEKLKIIAAATTNPNHIDSKTAEERGVQILCLKDEIEFLNTITGTSEMAAGLMIDLVRGTPWAFDDVKQYHWDRDRFRGHNLYGRTLGIFGLGRLGKWMARYGKAFNMNIITYSPHITPEEEKEFACRSVDFDTLLRESDVLSIHSHSTSETRGIFDKEAFAKMKTAAYLVNTAAGDIINEADLLEALEQGTIAGFGTDVLADELHFNESFNNYPLVEYAKTHENVIIVPHLGGMTHESREATDIFMAEKVVEALKKQA